MRGRSGTKGRERGRESTRDNIAGTRRRVSSREREISDIDLTGRLGTLALNSPAWLGSFAFGLSISSLFSGTLFMRPAFSSLFIRRIVRLDAVKLLFTPGERVANLHAHRCAISAYILSLRHCGPCTRNPRLVPCFLSTYDPTTTTRLASMSAIVPSPVSRPRNFCNLANLQLARTWN